MNIFEGLLLAVLIFPAAGLAGYAIVGRLVTLSAGVRLCLASSAGLVFWLWLVAMLNVLLPINFWAAWSVIGITWLTTLLLPYARQALISDLRTIFASTGAGWLVLAPLPLMAGMLLPMMLHPELVFHDGTSNHDSFFWITGAGWLQLHTYLTFPSPGLDPAVFSVSGAITGVSPAWGRMGTEGILALLASALGVQPLQIYVYAQVGLLPLWLASTIVFVRLVISRSLPKWIFCLGASLQPLFVFFAANNNLPNLLGALVAPVMLVAFVRLTEADGLTRGERVGWGAVVALTLHGLLCTYPEMAPFALLGAGVAVGAKLFQPERRARWRSLAVGVIVAGLAGLFIQPLTAWRAYQGFWNSLSIARTEVIWGNLFETLDVSAYVPAFMTLTVPACKSLGPYVGWLLSVLLIFTLYQVIRRARDRSTALASLVGFALLSCYSLATGFGYGWQKSVQFSGVIVAGIFTMGAYGALAPAPGLRSGPLRAAAIAALACLMAYTTIWGCARSFYWSENKALDESFLSMRALSRGALRDQPVEVVGATFGRSFFYSMWAAYALPFSHLTFDSRGEQMGGYLNGHLPHYDTSADGPNRPRAYLVSRAWADTFDADAVRLSSGAHHVLVARTNKVVAQAGLFPLEGVPQSASAQFSFTLLTYEDSRLEMDIALRSVDQRIALPLFISYGDPDRTDTWQTLKLEYPWKVRLPIRGGVKCQLKVEYTLSNQEEYPLQLGRLRVVRQ